eukprot:scaffold63_cov306-Pinguiococcus_pyrenoidosus.AAC.51
MCDESTVVKTIEVVSVMVSTALPALAALWSCSCVTSTLATSTSWVKERVTTPASASSWASTALGPIARPAVSSSRFWFISLSAPGRALRNADGRDGVLKDGSVGLGRRGIANDAADGDARRGRRGALKEQFVQLDGGAIHRLAGVHGQAAHGGDLEGQQSGRRRVAAESRRRQREAVSDRNHLVARHIRHGPLRNNKECTVRRRGQSRYRLDGVQVIGADVNAERPGHSRPSIALYRDSRHVDAENRKNLAELDRQRPGVHVEREVQHPGWNGIGHVVGHRHAGLRRRRRWEGGEVLGKCVGKVEKRRLVRRGQGRLQLDVSHRFVAQLDRDDRCVVRRHYGAVGA